MSDISYNVQGNLHEAWTVDDMIVEINGLPLYITSLLTYEILWTGRGIKGIISFIDYQNFQANGALDSGGIIKISYTSQKGSNYGSEAPMTLMMSIDKVDIGKEDNQVVTLQLKDILSSSLSVNFLNKSYKDMTPGDMLQQYTKDLGIENVVFAGPKETKEIKLDVSTPANLSGYEVLNSTTKKSGYNIIQDRTYTGVIHDENLHDELAVHTGETFYYRPKEDYTRFQVIDYKLNGFNLEALERSCAVETNKLTIDNSGQGEILNPTADGLMAPTTGEISNKPISESMGQKGLKMDSRISSSSISKDLNNLQTMSIWVPGWNGNRLGQKVTVELPRPENSTQSQNSETFSGDWVVERVLDKIVSSYFIQQLLLRRAGS